MAWDSRSGYCLTGGPPGPAAPFAPQMCFQPAYVPNIAVNNNAFSLDALNCQQNGNSVGACSYDAECGTGAVCDAGRCWKKNDTHHSVAAHSPWAYDAGNPRVVANMSWEQVADMMRAMGMESTFLEFAQRFAFGKTMFLVQHKGQTHIAVPLNVQYFRQDPQCSTCLKSIWQCSRYRDASESDPVVKEMYQDCLEMEQSFLYETMLPNGVIIPIMVKMNPIALQAASAALQKCAEQCGDCQPKTPMAMGGPQSEALFY